MRKSIPAPNLDIKTSLPHLFEFESKEAVTLRAHWHTGEVRQGNAGLHLAGLLVSQDNAVFSQQEDSSRALRTRAETVSHSHGN